MALSAYRNLLRAARLAFDGDKRVLLAARDQARAGFRVNAFLSPSDEALAPAVQHANEVAAFLRANVVQGQKEELRIHEHTERGDNDTIKMPNGGNMKVGLGCCST